MAYANRTIALTDLRFHWLNLFEPRKRESDDGKVKHKYEGTFIVEPDSSADKAIRGAIDEICAEQFGAKWEKVLEKLNADGRSCYKNGNAKTNGEGEVYNGFEDMMFFAASRDHDRKGPPFVFNKFRQRVTNETLHLFTEDAHPPRNGDYGAAKINFWALDGSGNIGRRIVADIELVMVLRDGNSLGVGGMSESDALDFASQYGSEAPNPIDENPGVTGLRK